MKFNHGHHHLLTLSCMALALLFATSPVLAREAGKLANVTPANASVEQVYWRRHWRYHHRRRWRRWWW